MDMSSNVDYVYESYEYHALQEAHYRYCGDSFLGKGETPLCYYLTERLGAVNWMIVEGENGNLIIQFIEETLESVPSYIEYINGQD